MKRIFCTICTLTVAVFLCSITSGAAAQTKTPAPAKSVLQQSDANKDGKVTADEVKADRTKFFKSVDTNKDGKVTAEEFQNATQKNFKEMDANKDGFVKVEEYVYYWCGTAPTGAKGKKTKDGQAPLFSKMDADKDGKATPVECAGVWEVRFSETDTNKDGKLTKDEVSAKMKDRFKEQDGADQDGIITLEEYNVYWISKDQLKKMQKGAAVKPAQAK